MNLRVLNLKFVYLSSCNSKKILVYKSTTKIIVEPIVFKEYRQINYRFIRSPPRRFYVVTIPDVFIKFPRNISGIFSSSRIKPTTRHSFSQKIILIYM